MRTASHPYNNRHRQAPSTHTDKQAVRTIGGEQCLIILVYISSATHPNKIGGFVVRGLFSSFMSCASHRKHTSKLNIFSQTIKVSDCFLSSSVYSSTKLYPQNAKTRQCKKRKCSQSLDCITSKCNRLSHNLFGQLVETLFNKSIPKVRTLKLLRRNKLLVTLHKIGRIEFLIVPTIDNSLPIPLVSKLIK